MEILMAAGIAILALAMGLPFAGAVVTGVLVWAAIHFSRKPSQAARVGTPVIEKGRVPNSAGDADGLSLDPSLRDYLSRLSDRITSLETEVKRLAGIPNSPAREESSATATIQPESTGLQTDHVPQYEEVRPQPELAESKEPVRVSPDEPIAPLQLPTVASPDPESVSQPDVVITPRPQPASPVGSSFFQRLVSGNIVAKVGAVVLFFGVGFLLKFAYDRNLVSPEIRLLAVALSAIGVFVLGRKLLERRRLYGLILQGVASGLAYLDVFFALKVYAFISVPIGFALFVVFGVATVLLAVRQDARPLALLGLVGAFLAPLLASTGGGNHVFLFTYYLLLNVFILAISWFKAWRALNIAGWFFTLVVSAIWGATSYRPEFFATTEPFLLCFFAIYLVIPILFATRQPPELKGFVDGTLVFGTPAAVATLQAKLVWGMPYGLAWSCALGAGLYAVLSVMVLRHRNMRLLGDTYIALAVGLGTLAIFYAFGAYTTFALWTIEGAALLWVCLRQDRLLGRLFALAVQAAGAAYFFRDFDSYLRFNAWFNDAIVGCLIIAVASVISAALYRRYVDRATESEREFSWLILAWGALCFVLGGLDAMHHGIADRTLEPAAALLFLSVTALVSELAGSRMRWRALRGLTVAMPLILVGVAVVQFDRSLHPLGDLGWVAWPIGVGSLFWALHRQRRDDFGAALEARYAAGWVVLAGLATWEAIWSLREREYLYCMGIALVGHVAAALRYWLRERGTDRARLSMLALLWSLFFWFGAGVVWLHDALPASQEARAALLLVAGSALVYELAQRWLAWPELRAAARLPWLAMPAAILIELARQPGSHPLGDSMPYAWPAVFVLAAWGFRREENDGVRFASGLRHALLLYVPLALVTWELLWWVREGGFGSVWRTAALALPACALVAALLFARNTTRWPLSSNWSLYRDRLVLLLVLALGFWSVVANVQEPGSLAPLSVYLPFLNPLDATLAVAAYVVVAWTHSLPEKGARHLSWKWLGAMAFVLANAVVLRTIHYWAGTPYRFDALGHSVLVQASLSILWTSTALALMLVARRALLRQLWIVGAVLLAAVVGKLFVVDLANSGTVERIVSFLGVGVLLLVIGYLAPVPPGVREQEAKEGA